MKEATRLVDISLDSGLNMFDTADVYSGGNESEPCPVQQALILIGIPGVHPASRNFSIERDIHPPSWQDANKRWP
ncbi:hypothetical protein [Archangium lansingense]|uniref:hypothetical protein n=1 Tax=Archangium lansingense TaxID=2995310 RepID=UPI00358DC291